MDCADLDCRDLVICTRDSSGENNTAACQDGADNDGDGAADCADSECQDFVFCAGNQQPAAPTAQPAQPAPAQQQTVIVIQRPMRPRGRGTMIAGAVLGGFGISMLIAGGVLFAVADPLAASPDEASAILAGGGLLLTLCAILTPIGAVRFIRSRRAIEAGQIALSPLFTVDPRGGVLLGLGGRFRSL